MIWYFFHCKLLFYYHINSIETKTLSMLSLVMRNYSSFNDTFTLKYLNISDFR